jgi:hypothetical protein
MNGREGWLDFVLLAGSFFSRFFTLGATGRY